MSADLPRIRMATVEDATAMAGCVTRAYEHYVARMGKPPGPMLEDYQQVSRSADAYVAQAQDGEICGVLVLVVSADRILLDNVAVAPGWQGQGLGRRVVDFAESQARQRGWRHLDLYTHELMVENIALYERLGYRQTSRVQEEGYARVYMRKVLAGNAPREA